MTATIASLMKRVQAILEWWNGTRPARALTRYSQANGGLLCGGIAYSAIFSLFAGLTIGYTVFMSVLGTNTELRDSLLKSIDSALPGLIQVGGGDGLINPDTLVMSTGFTLASIIAVVVLLVSAISCMGAIRSSVRVMFGLPPGGGNALLAKARELGAFVTVGLTLLVSAGLGIVLSSATGWLLGLLGIEDTSKVLLPLAGAAVSFVIDMGTFALVVVLLAGIRPPRKDLLAGSALAAVAFGVIRFLGTSVVARGAEANPIVASFAAIVTLLIWINLSARIVLTAAAFTANLPLEILKRQADEKVALDAIIAAREGRPLAPPARPEPMPDDARPAASWARRSAALTVAALAGFLVGRRRP
ncbi:membrane protein [Sanguibacter gelidistatuariae]|uniref:Membrane protein n=1 Tax=Sanguibacter gelidistatuariae TaxID=1814289 RepID=A0A1G6MGU7_9MICO|nr:YihY/virulence factor BrkB family protein [Sanguibacter gelidistatuariae]SDC54828.1 membrane protein [Sanguibacter gelidistatuariae]